MSIDTAPDTAPDGGTGFGEARRQDPRRAARRQVGQLQGKREVGQPGQQAQVQDPRRRHRARGCVGGGDARRARLPGRGVHVPRLAAAGALDRGPGRHQRGEELQGRRRLDPPPVLRHDQGRRLPQPRGQRAPPGPVVGRHHRPDGRPGCAVRPRVRRSARQPQLRWRPGQPHVLRPRADRAAAAARRLPAAGAPGRARQRQALEPRRDARRRRRRRAVRRHRHPRPADGRDRVARRARGGARHRRVRQRLLPVDQRDGVQHERDLARPPQGRLLRQPVLHADPPDVHPAVRRVPVEADADVRVAPQRRPRVGAGERRRDAAGARDPRARARLLPRAHLPELRQPRPARHRVACRQAGGRLGSWGRAAEERRVPRLRRGHRAARQGRRRGALREPVRDVRADHRREPVRDADADLSGVALHDGRVVGRLRADDHDPRPVLRR